MTVFALVTRKGSGIGILGGMHIEISWIGVSVDMGAKCLKSELQTMAY